MSESVTLFLCGDIMTGRGIDQILGHPGDPRLYESYARSALQYVELAERLNGHISRPVDDAYVWGEALAELERRRPAVRIANLETAITAADKPQPKGINYRMSPGNIGCLAAFRLDCCSVANNHVLDWGEHGLMETLRTLGAAGIRAVGAGADRRAAEAAAIMPLPNGGRVLVFAFADGSSGVPSSWAARSDHAGVNLLGDLSADTARRIGEVIASATRPNDIVVASVHWGANWGYHVPGEQRGFAHLLVDLAGVHVVHGHSSHHPKPFEIHHGKLILYGCGDFLTDYEGIRGYEDFRSDLALMYLPSIHVPTGDLASLDIVPFQIRNFRLHRASQDDARWLCDVLNREGSAFGTGVVTLGPDGTLALRAPVPPLTQVKAPGSAVGQLVMTKRERTMQPDRSSTPPTREEIVQLVGDLDDAAAAAILATGASFAEVEEAARRATGEVDTAAEAHPLSPRAEAVYDILQSIPAFARDAEER